MRNRNRKAPLEARKAEKALQIAVADMMEERRRNGDPVVVWKNGKVVRIPAKRITRGKRARHH